MVLRTYTNLIPMATELIALWSWDPEASGDSPLTTPSHGGQPVQWPPSPQHPSRASTTFISMNSNTLTSLSSASSQPAATPSMTMHTLPASESAMTRPGPTWSPCRGLDYAAELNPQVEKNCAAAKLDDDFEYATSFTRDDTFEGFSSSGDDAEEEELVSRAPEEAEESNADKTTSKILIWSSFLGTADRPSILPFTSTPFEGGHSGVNDQPPDEARSSGPRTSMLFFCR
ncbi:hypothetical protein DFH08DRAFT_891543 [Mycena albidolilacea]|uniref:Uncharacterized protein n=1 Tax=Mycena albidolilacea TaxID=1033008 RepID=A0AAD7EFL6_9AGAR|nr:hypothetical protein DFH08DRAFT_891543 [Mycena albidolilacea]